MTDGLHDDPARRSAARLLLVARLVGLVPAVLLGVVAAVLLGWVVGLVVVVVVAGLWVALVEQRRRGAPDRALAALGPSGPATDGGVPRARWENVVDGLSKSTGVDSPEVRYVDAAAVNAAAVVGGGRTVIVATSGLAESLSQVELEAVAANLLGRVRDGSAELATLAVGLPGPQLATSGPVTRLLVSGLGDQHDVRSDLEAARLTRYPPGVGRALRVVEERGSMVAGAAPGSAPLWLAPVVDAARVPAAVVATAMQPIALRTAVVDEL